MAKPIHVNSTKEFNSYLANTEYLVVDFHAVWCGPCHMINPILEKLASQHSTPNKIAFLKVDVDQQQELATRYGVTAMPTFLIIKDGKVIQNIRGANPPALNTAVQNIVKAVAAEPSEKTATDTLKESAKQETVSGSYGMSKGTNWKMSLN